MNCQNCGAPMTFDSDRIIYSCAYCSSSYFPEESRDGIRVTDVIHGPTCPVCKKPLMLGYVGKIRVTCCSQCRGILIDQFNFLTVIDYIRLRSNGIEELPPPVRMEDLKREILCPQCGRKMETHPYGGPGNIIIDNCPHCRLNWLDYMELHRVTHSPDRYHSDLEGNPNINEFQKKLFRP